MANAESKITTNHEKIRKWIEERDGKPARVIGTGNAEDPGVLRIDFPGNFAGDRLEDISWDQFFNKFEDANLAFLYQERLASGDESRFFKLIERN